MSRRLDDGESMIAERDGVIDGKIASHGSKVVLGQSQSHDGGRLLGKLLHESLIRSGHLRFQAPSVEDKAVAKMMIHMTVSRDEMGGSEAVAFDPNWTYAGNSQIHTGTAVLYTAKPSLKKGITVCVNAGHGTESGESVYTLCHPDGSAKVTGGSTAAGSTYAMAVAGGTTLLDGTPERSATLSLALLLKDKLLNNGYNVLMIRESDDVQLDNIARTLMANNLADCHIALHYDSTESDKGAFYMSVPDNASYRAMEPVASTWENDDLLGDSVIRGLSAAGVKIYSSGSLEADLTQTSYSTVPSIDLEVGDRASDHSENAQSTIADGIVQGVTNYFGR